MVEGRERGALPAAGQAGSENHGVEGRGHPRADSATRGREAATKLTEEHEADVSEQHLIDAVERIASYFWTGVHWEKTAGGMRMVREPLKPQHLERHINGGSVGLAPIVPGTSTTRVLVLDLDSHKGELGWDQMREVGGGITRLLRNRGMRPFAVRSSGGRGLHIYLVWRDEQDAYSVREFARQILEARGLAAGTGGVKIGQVEIFPKSDSVELDGFGNMVILALAGESAPLDPQTLEVVSFESVEASDWPESPPVPKLERPEPVQQHIGEISADLAELREQLQAIPNDGESLDYDAWRNVVFAIHHASQGSAEGHALAHEFSARSPKYDPEFLDERVWPYVKSERGGKVITARTIAALARENGWQESVIGDFEELPPEQETGGAVSGSAPDSTLDGPAPAGNRFRVLSENEFTSRPAPQWIIKGVLPRAELVLIIGQSTAGKSFVALDLAGAIAQGKEWRGLRVKKGRVVYVAAEGAGGFRNRLVAYKRHHEIEDTGIGVVPDSPNLLQKADTEQLLAAVRADSDPDVIIVDTLACVAPGGNENSAEDMGRVLAHCKALHRATGATIALVHHVGKDAAKGARGWSGIKAAADAELEVTRDGDARSIEVTKMKDGSDGAVFHFKLSVVPIGQDEDGEVIESCVVQHIDQASAKKQRQPTGILQKKIWRKAHELCELGDCAPVETLIEAVRLELVAPAKGEKDRRRSGIARSLNDLVDGRFLIIDGENVRVPDAG